MSGQPSGDAAARTGGLARVVDAVLEFPVVPSFTRLGYDIRSRVEHWRPLDSYDLSG